jgi:hypothetical protein
MSRWVDRELPIPMAQKEDGCKLTLRFASPSLCMWIFVVEGVQLVLEQLLAWRNWVLEVVPKGLVKKAQSEERVSSDGVEEVPAVFSFRQPHFHFLAIDLTDCVE